MHLPSNDTHSQMTEADSLTSGSAGEQQKGIFTGDDHQHKLLEFSLFLRYICWAIAPSVPQPSALATHAVDEQERLMEFSVLVRTLNCLSDSAWWPPPRRHWLTCLALHPQRRFLHLVLCQPSKSTGPPESHFTFSHSKTRPSLLRRHSPSDTFQISL